MSDHGILGIIVDRVGDSTLTTCRCGPVLCMACMSPSVDYFLSFFYILRLTLNPEHSHCNVMARMSTILVFYLFFHDFTANFLHVMTSFLVMVEGSHSLFGRYLRSKDS